MARSPKTPETKPEVANPPVTFTPEELQRVIAQATARAVAEATTALKADMQAALTAKAPAINGKSEASIRNEIAVVKAFKKAGFSNVKPHEDVRTFNRWLSAGYRPAEGSKSIKVKNLRLFHRSQCRPITPEEKAAMVEQSKAAIDRHTASVHQLNPQ